VRAHYSTYNLPADWLTCLTGAFKQQFDGWPDDPRLGVYLSGLETWRNKAVHPAIRLAGHVYLHIGYDLPRRLAVTLGADRGAMHVPVGSATLASPVPVAVAHSDWATARMLFLQAVIEFTSRGRRERIAAAIDALGRETYRRLAQRELPSPGSGASLPPLPA
jgi:hypothetical protein